MKILNKIQYAFLALAALLPAMPAQGQDLVILHLNDTHSQFETFTGEEHHGLGGIVRRDKYINQVRSQNENTLLLHAGDFSQGTPYFTLFKGDAEIEAMNALKYDAACLGNHEFDNGIEELARRIKNADFPVLCANYDWGKTELKDLVKPYVVIEKAGKRIGIIGLCVKLAGLVSPKNLEGIKYKHPYKVANKLARKLRNEEKCDIIILLTHCGFTGGEEQNPTDDMIAANTEGVDFIIGGHSHTFIEEPLVVQSKRGRKVLVVQAGEKGCEVGRLDVTF